jgi:hypothetical protein
MDSMSAPVGLLLLMISAGYAAAQAPLVPAATFAQPAARSGFGLVTAADPATRSGAQPALALSATLFRIGSAQIGSDILLSRSGRQQALALFSTGARFDRGSSALKLRLGAGKTPNGRRGPSVFTGDVAYERNGFRLLVGSQLTPGWPGGWIDTVLVTTDTVQLVRVMVRAPEPARIRTDAEIGYRLRRGRFEIDAALGQRLGTRARAWSAYGGVAYDVLPVLSVGALAGRASAIDWASQPTRTFGTLFLRFRRPAPQSQPGMGGVQSFEVRPGPPTELMVRAPRAARVEIAGNFTAWEPRRLQQTAPGEWCGSWLLAPGMYHIVVRVDGGAWLAPPGLPAVPDDFGGESGVFEVRGGAHSLARAGASSSKKMRG